jgi:hypothetical protein
MHKLNYYAEAVRFMSFFPYEPLNARYPGLFSYYGAFPTETQQFDAYL